MRRPRAPARKVPGVMNKTEERYSWGLTAQQRQGQILEWWYESLTLKLGPKCRYTPDFVVQMPDGELVLHEVKGFRRDDAMVKLRVCLERFPFRIFLNGEEFTG